MNGQLMKVWSAGSKNAEISEIFEIFWTCMIVCMFMIIIVSIIKIISSKECVGKSSSLIVIGSLFLILSMQQLNINKNSIKNNREIDIYIYSVENYLKIEEIPNGLVVVESDSNCVIMCKEEDINSFDYLSSASELLDRAIKNEESKDGYTE